LVKHQGTKGVPGTRRSGPWRPGWRMLEHRAGPTGGRRAADISGRTGSRGTLVGDARGPVLFFWPSCPPEAWPVRHHRKEHVSKRGHRAVCSLTNRRRLQSQRCVVKESSTLVPQRGHPLCTTVPHRKCLRRQGGVAPLTPGCRGTLGLSYRAVPARTRLESSRNKYLQVPSCSWCLLRALVFNSSNTITSGRTAPHGPHATAGTPSNRGAPPHCRSSAAPSASSRSSRSPSRQSSSGPPA